MIREQMQAKEAAAKVSAVDIAVNRAEAPYRTANMSEIAIGFEGPPKYLNQRDAPLEIPVEVVRKLFNAMDQDLDDAISLDELLGYVEKCKLPIDSEIVKAMYDDCYAARTKHLDADGINIDEIQFAVRGRHSWNP